MKKIGIFSIRRDNIDPEAYFTYRNQVTWDDCPHLKAPLKLRERRSIERKYGRNSFIVKSMLYGRFHKSDSFERLFTENELASVRLAMQGHAEPFGEDVVAAMDVTGGNDSGVFMRRQGTHINLVDDNQVGNELDMADYWIGRMKELGIQPHQAWIDAMGIGGTIVKHMRRMGVIGINPFTANQNPGYNDIYQDRYTEIAFAIKMMIQLNVLSFSAPCENLLRDMRTRRYVMMSKDKIKTEPKPKHRARENFSPDYLDTLIYLFAPFDQTLLENMVLSPKKGKHFHKGKKIEELARERMAGGMDAFGGMPDQPGVDELFRPMS